MVLENQYLSVAETQTSVAIQLLLIFVCDVWTPQYRAGHVVWLFPSPGLAYAAERDVASPARQRHLHTACPRPIFRRRDSGSISIVLTNP